MKTLFIALALLAFVFVNTAGYSYGEKRALEDASAKGVFLSFLKRQNKDLRRTIETLEEMQQKQSLTSAKEAFWFAVQNIGESNRCCSVCPGRCECCQRTGIGFCCNFIDNKFVKDNDSNEE